MTDLLLNMQGILLTIGLPSIDESIDKLLVAMRILLVLSSGTNSSKPSSAN